MRIFLSVFAGIAFSLLSPQTGLASTKVCEAKDWRSLAQELEDNAPEIRILQAKNELRQAEEDSARIHPSSVFNGQYTAGGAPWKKSSLEASYLFTVEKAEKRIHRLSAAEAQSTLSAFERKDFVAKQLLQLGLLQQRVRTLLYLREILLETDETYSNIIRLYQRIPSRGPEQETSLSVFQIAKGENDLRIAASELEQRSLLAELSLLSACPDLRFNWKALPQLNLGEENISTHKSSSEGLLEAKIQAAEKSLLAEQSSYLSDLSIGPVVLAERGDEDKIEFGLALSYPLSGSITSVMGALKSKEARLKTLELDLDRDRLHLQKRLWLEQYQWARSALKEGMNPQAIAKKHGALEKLFRSDRVSASLIIEAHRQMYDHVHRYAELESKAVESLWNLRYLGGDLSWRNL